MAYEKRLCLLKQIKRGFSADGAPLSGAVYAERMGSELVITPKIAGLSPLKEGRYALVVAVGELKFCLALRGNEPLRVDAAPSLANGFSVLLCYVNAEAEAIAFGHCGSAPSDYGELISAVSAPSLPAEPKESALAEDLPPFRGGEGGYDDEAIASSDYYGASHADEDPSASDPPPEGEGVCEDETALHPFRLTRGGLTYYNKIAAKLKTAFQRFPRDERLTAAIPHSEWVKTEQALLGIVYAEGVPRYLCVALEKDPPEEAKEASVFVPFSPFSDDEGLFVVFQDADTGEYVKVDLA